MATKVIRRRKHAATRWTPPVYRRPRAIWYPQFSMRTLLLALLATGPLTLWADSVSLVERFDYSFGVVTAVVVGHGLFLLLVVAIVKQLPAPVATIVALLAFGVLVAVYLGSVRVLELATDSGATVRQREAGVYAVTKLLVTACLALGAFLGWIIASAEAMLRR